MALMLNEPPPQWAFKYNLTTENVWDGFSIVALWEDCMSQSIRLVVPHDNLQKDRFKEAMKQRNIRIRLYGQPELTHYCSKCTRFYFNDEGLRTFNLQLPWFSQSHGKYALPLATRKVQVVVTDGVTVGHPCCAVHNCHIPLASNRHRFCPVHAKKEEKCSIVGCEADVVKGQLTCVDPTHQAVERTHTLRGQARFQLKERLVRQRVAHPNNSEAIEIELRELEDLDEEEQIYELHSDGQVSAGTLGMTQDAHPGALPVIKIRAEFCRKRTHNEQLMVDPCGMIPARETMYGAESTGSVIVSLVLLLLNHYILTCYQEMIKRVYRIPGLKPNHIFYDNNCTLSKMVRSDPFFDNIGLSVDVFHFKCKHSESDVWCNEHCNPASFPELMTENGWYFNSSIAEQTNVWFGGFHSICREMLVDKYNFFLDEMIMRRNRMTLSRLGKYNPGHHTVTLS